MIQICEPPKSLQRVYGRGSLLSILEMDRILTKVSVLDDGCFATETRDWDSYWQPVYELEFEDITESLGTLNFAWRDYNRAGFGAAQRQSFCHRYFSLLDKLLAYRSEFDTKIWLRALQTTLGFECFGVVAANGGSEVLAAGTCTLRNPCYLLAKLKMPDTLDDPRFLPVITTASAGRSALFYHYRQYTMSHDSPVSLLLYPRVSSHKRSASFRLLNSLAGGVSYGIDPRTVQRAKRLFRGIIQPIIEANKPYEAEKFALELVDVGAGSGSLSAAICREIRNTGLNLKFRLWFVDLEPAGPVRFFRNRNMRSFVDSLTFLGGDYCDWLSRPQPLPAANGLRIALASKLFNNLSRFSIQRLSGKEICSFRAGKEYPDLETCRPSICLAPGGSGVKSLVISNTRFPFQDGRTFVQASLSSFYQGLYLLSGQTDSNSSSGAGFFLPVRSFAPECLVTKDGKSVITCLSENSDYIIIEDADLRPQDIIDHAAKFSLGHLTIRDMTKALKLKGNYLYVVWPKARIAPLLAGEQIW